MAIQPGYRVFETLTPLTVAASPLLSPWIDSQGFTRIYGWLAVAGGTTVCTVEYGTDGVSADADFTPQSVAAGASALDVLGPWLRVRIVQTVADATKTKLFIQARA